jgi:anti-anti-sigma factor
MNNPATVLLPNRFDYGFHTELLRQCSQYIGDAAIDGIIFDFSRVEYLDSAALGMLLMWQRRAAAVHKKMMIKGARGDTAEVLAMANMQRIFEFI